MMQIPLTRGMFALVDDEDYALVSQWRWHAHTKPSTGRTYARRNINLPDGRRGAQHMHQLILGVKGGDHENGNGLDNRRENLRLATKAQNGANQLISAANSSGFKGVSWRKAERKWAAYIRVDGKDIALGNHHDPHVAANEYNKAAVHFFGDFACLNPVGIDPRAVVAIAAARSESHAK